MNTNLCSTVVIKTVPGALMKSTTSRCKTRLKRLYPEDFNDHCFVKIILKNSEYVS